MIESTGVRNEGVVRKDVFDEYFMYYTQISPDGNTRVCRDTQVIAKAKRFLLMEVEPNERFKTFPFYQIACEAVQNGLRDCKNYLRSFIKAMEVLEMFCVNLFLYPWKKEIKTLKTFTGPFVYCIQPVLSDQVVKSVLEGLGYHQETDTQYRLSQKADQDRAAALGLELFLARVECDYLLEVLGQRSSPGLHKDWADLLNSRAEPGCYADISEGNAREEMRGEARHMEEEEVKEEAEEVEEQFSGGCSLLDPVATEEIDLVDVVSMETERHLDQDSQVPSGLVCQKVKELVPQETATRTVSFSPDDRSIMEMQRNYPDLAIRGRPLLPDKKPKTRRTAGGTDGISGPPSLTMHIKLKHTVSEPVGNIFTTASSKPRSEPLRPGREDHIDPRRDMEQHDHKDGGDDDDDEEQCLQLAMRMGQLDIRERKVEQEEGVLQYLKYPVKETTPLCTTVTLEYSEPIMCHPCPVRVCHIPNCHSCGGGDREEKKEQGERRDGGEQGTERDIFSSSSTVREPPHSVYVPDSSMEGPAIQLRHQALEGPTTQLHQQALEGQIIQLHHQDLGGPSTQLHQQVLDDPTMLLHSQPSEDELINTYVLI